MMGMCVLFCWTKTRVVLGHIPTYPTCWVEGGSGEVEREREEREREREREEWMMSNMTASYRCDSEEIGK